MKSIKRNLFLMGCINSTSSASSPHRNQNISDSVDSPGQQLQSLLSECNTLMEQIDHSIPTHGEALRSLKYNAYRLKIDIERRMSGETGHSQEHFRNTLQVIRQDFNAICFRELNENQFRYSGEQD